MIREGRTYAEIAEHFGWASGKNPYQRLKTRGLRRADLIAA